MTETIGTNRQLRQYQSAIVEQTFEIRRVKNDLQDNECSSGSMVIINGDDDGTCTRIEDSLQRMQQNLRDLVEKRDRLRRDHGSDGVTRGQLATALHANGCDDADANGSDTIISNRPETTLDAEPDDAGTDAVTPLDQSGGPSGEDENLQSPIQSYAYGQSSGGNLRTVCVRTCDGGFFPMTPNAGPGDFQRDGENCAKMCPGVKTELFFHRLPDQETSAMVSAASGAPYSAMPYAFAFRKRQPNEKTSCTCNLPAYYEEMRRQNALTRQQPAGTPPSSVTTIGPKAAPPAAPTEAAKTDTPPIERPYDPAAGGVRQVGPTFLPPDQRKLDLAHPAAPGAQPEQ
ncbi:MAG: DUF2865 domain-containing protein [Rhizobium sp.]